MGQGSKHAVNTEHAVQRIGEEGIVPVVRAAAIDDARRAIDAIHAGGISIIEVTLTVPNATEVIYEVARQYGSKIFVGAGTVTTSAEAEKCIGAGARFLVSPGLSLGVIRTAKKARVLCIPGAMTPTELMAAREAGAQLVKIFPCGNLGGPKYIKALRGPFPEMKMIPTGGVNLTNAAEYIEAGAFALGVGGDLVDAAALRAGNAKKITETAHALADTIRRCRAAAN
jgi:2-dehydro-3-deoxyphosphogluconate aldolase/(4S)-4-hydroxy-2-oxoglutarate aldolase